MNITLLNSQPNIQKSYKQNSINFCGANKIVSFNKASIKNCKNIASDVFEFNSENLNKIYKKSLDNIWGRIKKQTESLTPEKLEKAVADVKLKHPKNSEKEILTVMQKLTQWSDYGCFKILSEELNKIGFVQTSISDISAVQNIFYYLLRRKMLCNINNDNNMNYNFVLKNNVETIIKLKNVYYNNYINLEGFDDGINFFTSNEKLAELTNDVLTKINRLRSKSIFLTFNKALDKVLNGKIETEMQKKGLNCKTISINNPPTRDSILQQTSPIKPESKEVIDNMLNVIANYFEPKHKNNALLLKTKIAQFYEQKLDIYSKERLVSLMREMNDKIIEYQKENNLSSENLFYAIGPGIKSSSLITYMFAKVNNIPKEKIVYYTNDANTYPPNSTIVLLDDMAISGDSLKKIKTQHLAKNQNVLYCPLIAYSTAISEKNKDILRTNRENNEKILYSLLKDDELEKDEIEKDLINYFKKDCDINRRIILGDSGFYVGQNSLGECTVFPYMAPDNNVGLASFLLYKFVPNPNALKNQHTYLHNIMQKIENHNKTKVN